MNKIFITIAIVYIILSAVIITIKPQMHKPVVFSSKEALVENIPEKTLEEEPQIIHVQQYEEAGKIKVSPQNSEFAEKPVKTVNMKPEFVKKEIIAKPQKNQTQTKPVKTGQIQNQSNIEQKPKYELPQSIKDIVNNRQPKTSDSERVVKIQQSPIQQKTVETKPKPSTQKNVQVQNNTPLTEAEEIIVWNKWRSDLQNKVMRDSKVVAERGTVFRFSFTVNKFGQISNLKVWSDTPAYTNYAIKSLKPLLLSYQGQPILNFPSRTKRITTNVSGAFVISNQDRFTTPGDYSDIERVRN